MRITCQPRRDRGVAIIIVMLVIVALAILATLFATQMKTETKLARNASFGSQLEWAGRSGVELARFVVGQQATIATEPYDSLNQKWAGGPMGTNDVLANIHLEDNELGPVHFSVKIVDAERKYNINCAIQDALAGDPSVLQQVLTVMGVDAGEFSPIVSSLMDWVDQDNDTHIGGAENDFYHALPSPYQCKNGLIDDMQELLLIHGIAESPEIFYGPDISELGPRAPRKISSSLRLMDNKQPPSYPFGFKHVFTPISARLVNVNTASAQVLQIMPGMDENSAQAIITQRAGPDGVDGTEDDMPYRNVGEVARVAGFNSTAMQILPRFFSVRSVTFEVTVTATMDTQKGEWVALIRRDSPTDVKILSFHRK